MTYAEQIKGEFSVFLAPTPERRLWIADQYAYRLRRLSPAGKLEEELTVGKGQVAWSERTHEEWTQLKARAKREGFALSRRSLSPVRAEEVFRAFTLGRDGFLYLLVRTESGLALDRYHPALLTLDRVLLKGIEVPGRVMIAGGRQGIYIAAWGRQQRRVAHRLRNPGEGGLAAGARRGSERPASLALHGEKEDRRRLKRAPRTESVGRCTPAV